MKRYLLLLALTLSLAFNAGFAGDKQAGGDELMRKSKLTPDNTFPLPFSPLNNPVNQPAVSTGYYFVDGNDEAPDYWRPVPDIVDTTVEPLTWRRILPGPRIVDPSYWTENPKEGLRFFRNPAYPVTGTMWVNPTDSTDDAIAGPMEIGFGFYFNGLRFDSFYVSTNGIIALTNRRYTYGEDGGRMVLPGATNCYDPMSMDWFVRPRSADPGLDDPTPDNYGYTYAVLGGSPSAATAGIRQRGGALNSLPNRTHVIAPFFGDLVLSQSTPNSNLADDFGKVYYKKSPDKLIIYYVNAQPKGDWAYNPGGATVNFSGNARPGDANSKYASASAQIVLDRRDSSITIIWQTLEGQVQTGGLPAYVTAPVLFRYNTTVGVRGFARHVNYGQGTEVGSPWSDEYEQYTHYFNQERVQGKPYPQEDLAVRFKQWKNSVRVVDIQYMVRQQDPSADLNFTVLVPSTQVNNYELLAGEERIGAIQPVAIMQNLTNNIQGPQGVNFTPQQLKFRARFRIVNEASGRIIYNRLVPIDSTCLATPDTRLQDCTGDPYTKVRLVSVTQSGGNYTATPMTFPGTNNYNGIPPYGFVQISFPPFEPNEFVLNHIGRMRAYIIADPTDPATQESLTDAWPFDDTTSVNFFVMKRLTNFNDDVTEFHTISGIPMPSVVKWVNIGALADNGDDVSVYPLPPRGEYVAQNVATSRLRSPVIRMDRKTLDGQEHAGSAAQTTPAGDQIRSFPIDLRRRLGAVLSLSIQRAAKSDNYTRRWSDDELVGIEPRSVLNNNVFSPYNDGNAASAKSNEIHVQLAQPSPDGIKYITNIPDARWQNHWRRGGAAAVTDVPAYTLYGAGGAQRGFLETDKDSALSKPSSPSLNGLRPDFFDDGFDWEYKKVFIAIPDTIINSPYEGAKNFRFRVRGYFYDDNKCTGCIVDDDDKFFVDNVKILFPSEVTDIEISNVNVRWPYTLTPASQAIKLPVRVKVSNNTSKVAPTFLVRTKIYRGQFDHNLQDSTDKPIYCRTEQIPFMPAGSETEVPMPNWNVKDAGAGQYRVYSYVMVNGGDLEPRNDTTYTDFTIQFGDEFAYEKNPTSPVNDVPSNSYTAIPGRGLNMFGYNAGGPDYDEVEYGAGATGGSGSGTIAAKFQLVAPDTIKGIKVYWGNLNQAGDEVAIAIYNDAGLPSTLVNGTVNTDKRRGRDDIRNTTGNWNQYVTLLFDQPKILPAGTYWAAVSQLGETGMELGASESRTGMRTTNVYIPPSGILGAYGINLMLDKNFRTVNPNGELVNNNFFAYENSRGSGQWVQFMPTTGNPAYAHMNHFGTTPQDGQTKTLSRGTWIPLIRPYFGARRNDVQTVYQECVDDTVAVPVEISDFNGRSHSAGIYLDWATASEINNAGFYVERKTDRQNDEAYTAITFQAGAGNSSSMRYYNYIDKDVIANTVYQYRLRQVDVDGAANCEAYSKVVSVMYTNDAQLVLEQNEPNPFANVTTIRFNNPTEANGKLEVLDIYGNVIKTLASGTLAAKEHSYVWDGYGDNGKPAVSGTYIYRLTIGDKTLTNKMSIVR